MPVKKTKNIKKSGGLDLDINAFLVGEFNSVSAEINSVAKEIPKKQEKKLSELDNLILSEVAETAWALTPEQKLSPLNSVKIKIGDNNTVSNGNQIFNDSVHRLDLRSKKDAVKVEAKAEAPKSFFNSFEAPSLLKKPSRTTEGLKYFLNFFKKHRANKHNLLVNRVANNYEDVEEVEVSPFLQNLKTASYFALIALLVITSVRISFLTLQFKKQANNFTRQVLGVSEEAASALKEGSKAASNSSWEEAALNFSAANDYFSQAQTALNSYNQSLISFVESIPIANEKVKSAKDLLEAGRLLSQASVGLSSALSTLQPISGENVEMASALGKMRGTLETSSDDLESALKLLGGVDAGILPVEYSNSLREMQNNLPKILQNLQELKRMFKLAEALAGYEQPKRYLLIFQNNNELRSAGGFMGSFALIDIKDGKITNLEVPGGGFYDLQGSFFEKIIAPDPMRLLGASWQIWNANWFANFSDSAKKIEWFYEKSGGPTVDGIFAVNATILPEILKLTGNVELPEYEQILTPSNVVIALQHEAEFNYDKKENKPKKIIGELVTVVSDKLFQDLDGKRLINIFSLFNNALSNKEIQLYFNDSSLQKEVESFGWAGKVAETDGDYLMVTRDNIAGGKTDGFITQSINHEAKIQNDGSIIGTVDITLTHNGDKNDVFGKVLNKSFIRVYVPKGSTLLSVSGYDTLDPILFKEVPQGFREDTDLNRISGESTIDPETNTVINDEFNKAVFGNWLLTQPGENKTLSFSYRLPKEISFTQSLSNKIFSTLHLQESIAQEKYSFLFQNQSGIQNSTLNSVLLLPNDTKIAWQESTAGSVLENKEGSLQFTAIGKGDSMFGVVLQKNQN
jgi:hypothetical protein